MSVFTSNLRSQNVEYMWEDIHTKEFQKIESILTKCYNIYESIVLSVGSSSKE